MAIFVADSEKLQQKEKDGREKRESIAIVLFAIIAIIVSIVAILELYVVMKSIWIKLLVISFVTIPLAVVYNDYKCELPDILTLVFLKCLF